MSDTIKGLQERLAQEQGESPSGGLEIVKVPTIQVTVAELKEVISKAEKNCPIAKAFKKGIIDYTDDYHLAVEKPDLEACLSGRCCETKTSVCPDTGAPLRTKVVVDHKPKAAPATPKTPPKT